ncbi:unnamed protein product, partial [Vitis vinifera]|uniref:Uncharacterized protein n=1 Tax=Vitis vinifera TaxID=29760 RepID=D7T2F0_VITVI
MNFNLNPLTFQPGKFPSLSLRPRSSNVSIASTITSGSESNITSIKIN